MFFKKIILYFYCFLTGLLVFAPVNITIIEFTPAILFLWVTYLFFIYGLRLSKTKTNSLSKERTKLYAKESSVREVRLFTLFIVALFFIPLYIKFYTGSSLLSSLTAFISGKSMGKESTYYMYQTYFKEQELNVFSLKKVPYIVGFGIVKFYTWYFTIKLFGFVKKPLFKYKAIAITLLVLQAFVGVSRGTSFELFEIILIIFFSLLLRVNFFYGKSWFFGKTRYVAYTIVGAGVLYFMISKAMRYDGNISYTHNITKTLLYDKNSFSARFLPIISLVANSLSGYFLFGLYFISFSIIKIWFGSVEGFLSTLLPKGVSLFGLGDSYRRIMCSQFIDCGAAWVPDSILIINNCGVPIYLLVLIISGYVSGHAYKYAKIGSVRHALLLFLIVLFMFSLPVGNFITSSSSTVIVLLLIVFSLSPLRYFVKK